MALLLNHVEHVYGKGTAFEKVALYDINLQINEGEFIGLIGHTGSGKSTLIQHLNGLLKPTDGGVYYNGEDINEKGFSKKKLRSKVGIVFQYPEQQLFETTVLEDVKFGPKNLGLDNLEMDMRSYEALKQVGIGEDLLDVSPFELSGGQKRRVAIAGVLAMQPEILILDEPTAGLDPRERVRFRNLISALADRRIILLSTHIVSDVEYIADEILMMREGKLIHTGNPEKIICPMQGKVWECHSDAAGAKALSRQHTIANLRREKDAVVLRVIAEHPPMPQARMLTPTLEDLYLYCFGEEQDDAHADRI